MYENSDYFRLLVFQSIKLEEALVHGYDSEVGARVTVVVIVEANYSKTFC